MEQLFDLPTLISTYGYIGVFVIVFLESGIFFALPGDSLLFTAGLFAVTGFMNIYYLIALVFVATFFGGIAGYYVGYYIEKLRRFRVFQRVLKEEYIDKTRKYLDKHGRLSIVLARFVPLVRTFMPIVAGIANMKLSKYLRYNFIGSLLWSVGVTLVGYFLGGLFPNLKDHLHWLVIWVVIISCLPMIGSFVKSRKQQPQAASVSEDPV